MKKITTLLLFSFAIIAGAAPNRGQVNVIPAPAEVTINEGFFKVAGATVSYSPEFTEAGVVQIENFARKLTTLTGKRSVTKAKAGKKGIVFQINTKLAEEEYTIKISEKAVVVGAASLNGVIYALSTISQMLPVEYFGAKAAPQAACQLPCCEIRDYPRFGYRGALLDVSRHFFDVTEVKKFIDIMALYKMNRFHWHLTNDQGWRVEIKKYPRLTEIGSKRGAVTDQERRNYGKFNLISNPHEGYYTQDQIREVVKYASSLGITIIPEIDLPGHMLSALASYPELGCTGGPYKVWRRWGICDEVLCAGKDFTFEFLEDVFTEICELFPSEYIHIGGDECPKKAWENCPDCQARIKELGLKSDGKYTAEQYQQNYVSIRIQKFLENKGRKVIGWDEILEGELASGATVMSWRGIDGGIEASKKGLDVIMTPYTYLYLDYYQSPEKDKEPPSIAGPLTIEKVYSFNPYEGLNDNEQKHIIGVQCNLWTEFIATNEHLEYMLLPRMLAVSEVQWCTEGNRDYERFKEEVTGHQFNILDALGYTYSKAITGTIGLPHRE